MAPMAAALPARAVSKPKAKAPGSAFGLATERTWNGAPAGPNTCVDGSMSATGLSFRVRFNADPLFLRVFSGGGHLGLLGDLLDHVGIGERGDVAELTLLGDVA